jgi:outer membrane protein OmpA-like peptidoglycan-associated protein
MKALPLLIFLSFVAGPAAAQQPADAARSLQFKVLDLVFKIQDMGGRVEQLAVKETTVDVRVELAADVLFDFDKADLLPTAEATLKQAADFIQQRAGKQVVRIDGYTDGKGSDDYNRKLSHRRADSVKKWFQSHGLGATNFVTDGLGAANPVAPNTKPDGSDDPEGRQKNRRVEIVIKK